MAKFRISVVPYRGFFFRAECLLEGRAYFGLIWNSAALIEGPILIRGNKVVEKT